MSFSPVREITEYLLALKDKNIPITFHQFLQDKKDFVVQHTTIEECANIVHVWNSRFGAAVKDANVALKSTTKKVDWTPIMSAVLARISNETSNTANSNSNTNSIDAEPDVDDNQSEINNNNSSCRQSVRSVSRGDNSSTTSGKSLSKTSSGKLSETDKQFVKEAYSNFYYPKWQLSTGKIVEDEMERLAMRSDYEHLSHSIIIDPNDKLSWSQHFTESELDEIRNHHVPVLEPFPSHLQQYMDQYKGVHELDELIDISVSKTYHPRKEADLYWLNKTVMAVVELYVYNYNFYNKTENDIVRRVWSFLETSFDATDLEVTCGEKASLASSESKNNERSISGSDRLSRHVCGNKMDMIIANTTNEYGCGEAGLTGGTTSTKWINEYMIKVPKTLKDMAWRISKRAPSNSLKVVVAAYVINGLQMAVRVLDNPKGNVSRVLSLGPMDFPTSATEFYPLILPLVTVAWQIKQLLQKTASPQIDSVSIHIPTFQNPSKQATISRSMPDVKKGIKRKHTDSEEQSH